nr:transposase [Pasteuria penetrans]
MNHTTYTALPAPICDKKMENDLLERVQYLQKSGLSYEKAVQTVGHSILHDKNWENSTIGKAWTWLANYERDQYLGRKKYQRDNGGRCTIIRNGYRKHVLDTHRGPITFFIPRLRDVKFQSVLADPYFRYDPYLLEKIVSLRISGMSLEVIAGQTKWIFGKRIPRSTLSQRLISQYDSHLDAWNLRSLQNQYSALQADATYLRIRGGKGKKIAIYIVMGRGWDRCMGNSLRWIRST